ncbi:MAG: methyltransferase domain-containing protein [Chloroflexota bacterium]|nr:methyltransferase domain-containing protein [Chloroflexota bacterium]
MSNDLSSQAVSDLQPPRPSVVAAIASLPLAPGMRLLDAGCGDGGPLGLLAAAVAPGGEVIGFDQDRDSLEAAAARHNELIQAGSVWLEAGDLLALPFADSELDGVWMSSVLHHIERPVAALAELARVVRPGGFVAVLDGDDSGSFPLLPWEPAFEQRLRTAAARAAAEQYGGTLDYYFDGYIGRHLLRLAREAGLTDIRLQAFTDVDRSPLPPARETALREWFLRWFEGRVRDYLAPVDHARFTALFDPGLPDYVFASPDFFMVRTSLLAVGQVAS